MNIFVLSSVVPGIPTMAIWRGVMPYVAADMLRMATLIAFPAISLWLPKWLGL
jgi:TRAP-type C4-dicarboxylate transport system permease large subunit